MLTEEPPAQEEPGGGTGGFLSDDSGKKLEPLWSYGVLLSKVLERDHHLLTARLDCLKMASR